MAEQSRKNRAETQGAIVGHSVDALASKALTMVAERNAKSLQDQDIDLVIAERLRDAAAESSGNPVPDVLDEMLRSGMPPETIACVYIPHAARQMGEDWCDDTLSFARVTIGTARLQASLRTLGADWASHGYSDDPNNDEGVVVIIAKDAFHTLGAMVLCGQLRRLGLSVRLAMGASSQELRAILGTTNFDAALISASSSESLESLRECVDVIRQSSENCPPIIIGGNVLDQEADVKTITGADYTTKDPLEALEHCGIAKTSSAETLQQTRRT
jgi:methanogenic corrinoid protein MtbC1